MLRGSPLRTDGPRLRAPWTGRVESTLARRQRRLLPALQSIPCPVLVRTYAAPLREIVSKWNGWCRWGELWSSSVLRFHPPSISNTQHPNTGVKRLHRLQCCRVLEYSQDVCPEFDEGSVFNRINQADRVTLHGVGHAPYVDYMGSALCRSLVNQSLQERMLMDDVLQGVVVRDDSTSEFKEPHGFCTDMTLSISTQGKSGTGLDGRFVRFLHDSIFQK